MLRSVSLSSHGSEWLGGQRDLSLGVCFLCAWLFFLCLKPVLLPLTSLSSIHSFQQEKHTSERKRDANAVRNVNGVRRRRLSGTEALHLSSHTHTTRNIKQMLVEAREREQHTHTHTECSTLTCVYVKLPSFSRSYLKTHLKTLHTHTHTHTHSFTPPSAELNTIIKTL